MTLSSLLHTCSAATLHQGHSQRGPQHSPEFLAGVRVLNHTAGWSLEVFLHPQDCQAEVAGQAEVQ